MGRISVQSGGSVTPGSSITMDLAPGGPPGEHAAIMTTTCSFAGDFDVQVSYAIELGFAGPPGGRLGIVAGNRMEGPAIENAYVNGDATIFDPGTERGGSRPLSAPRPGAVRGELRLSRQGSTFTGYVQEGLPPAWTQVDTVKLGTVDPTPISLKLWADGPIEDTRVMFTDFVLNSGTCN
jgi:hypothetical protein